MSATPTTNREHTRSRPLQFTILGMVLAVLVFSGLLLWVGPRWALGPAIAVAVSMLVIMVKGARFGAVVGGSFWVVFYLIHSLYSLTLGRFVDPVFPALLWQLLGGVLFCAFIGAITGAVFWCVPRDLHSTTAPRGVSFQFTLKALLGLVLASSILITLWNTYREPHRGPYSLGTACLSLGLIFVLNYAGVNSKFAHVKGMVATVHYGLLVGLIVGLVVHFYVIGLIASKEGLLSIVWIEDYWGGWFPYRGSYADGILFRTMFGLTTGALLAGIRAWRIQRISTTQRTARFRESWVGESDNR